MTLNPDSRHQGVARSLHRRFFGIWPDVWRSPLDFCLRAAALGGVVHLSDFPRTLYLVTSPSAIRRVLVDKAGNYPRGTHWRRAKAILGEGLATTDGDAWRRQRSITQQAFRHDRVTRAIPVMHEGLDEVLDAWRATKGLRDITNDLAQLALHVLLRGLFDVDLRADAAATHQAVSAASRQLSNISLAPWGRLPWLAGITSPRHRASMAFLEHFVGQIISRCRDRSNESDGLVSILLRLRDEDGKPMPDRYIRDELMTMLTAAVETQVSVLKWLLVVLATMPHIHAEVEAEARVSGGRVTDLTRARQTVDETLRLYPSGWIFDRVARHDDILDGVAIRKGSTLLICPYATHRHPDLWPDPEHFDPDRFLPERVAQRVQYSYLPFGAGQRTCIGAPFAIALATLFVSRTAGRFRCILSAPLSLLPRAGALLTPPRGMQVQFDESASQRSQSPAASCLPPRQAIP